MRALVTGAGGFVGRYLVDHLLRAGDEVVGITLPGSGDGLPCKTDHFEITDIDACSKVISAFKPQAVFHLAGIAFVPEAEEDFQKTLNVNVLGTSNICKTLHLLDLECTFLFISSAEVYGKIKPSQLPITENTTIAPSSNYSLSKVMAELVAKRYASDKLKTVILRPFNHIGPGQDSRFVVSNFARQLAQIKLGKKEPYMNVGNLEARRDFSDVRDIVRAYRLAAEKGHGLYNLASGKSISIRSILDLLLSVTGLQVEIRQDPSRMRAVEIPELKADISRPGTELGWKPEYELRDTLKDIYNYWLDRES